VFKFNVSLSPDGLDSSQAQEILDELKTLNNKIENWQKESSAQYVMSLGVAIAFVGATLILDKSNDWIGMSMFIFVGLILITFNRAIGNKLSRGRR